MNTPDINRSTLAKQLGADDGMRDPKLAAQREIFGFLVHTTGGGVTEKAKKEHRDPVEVAIATYAASQNGSNRYMWGGPGYLCDHDGALYQLAPDNAKTAHCGSRSEKYPEGTRSFYLDGSWVTKITTGAVELWRKQWPIKRHPYSLFPSTDPNTDYVGVEMIPIGDGFGGSPMRAGLRFTKAQHDTIAALGVDLARRHRFPSGWERTTRLVGHEDVDPLNRADSLGGWDPGWNRPEPFFDFEYVRRQITGIV